MTKEKEINILMADRCSKNEAEHLLANGTIIWENPEEWIQNLKDSDCYDGQTVEDAIDGRLTNVSGIKIDGTTYIIEYVC